MPKKPKKGQSAPADKQNGSSMPSKKNGKGKQSKAAAAAYASRVESTEPRITRTSKSMRVVHRELVSEGIPGAVLFDMQASFQLNPGLPASFPWLSTQAENWETYKVHKLCVDYISAKGTGVSGQVYISPNYDASDPPPLTERQIANNVGTVSDNIWSSFTMHLDPSAMMGLGPRKFVRPCAVAGDIKTFDVGTLNIATVGCADASIVGRLWFDYDIEFFTPQSDPSPAIEPLYNSIFTTDAVVTNFATGVPTPLHHFIPVYNPLRIQTANTYGANGDSFIPPAGCYRVHYDVTIIDNTAENFSVYSTVYVNGAAFGDQTQSDFLTIAGGGISHSADIILPCNGTDVVSVWCTVYGAAGTLQAPVNRANRVLFSLA